MLEDAPLWQNKAPIIADVGTGSGGIVISLALERPEGRYIATDISAAALALARENAARHGVSARIRFVAGIFLPAAPPKTTFQHSAECWNVVTADSTTFANLDAVVSNPPYIRTADWAQLERSVRDFEPKTALVGGPTAWQSSDGSWHRHCRRLSPAACSFWKSAKTRGQPSWNWRARPGFRESQCGRTWPAKTGWCGR